MDEQAMMESLHEVFDPSMPRLGPGDDDGTTRALRTALSAMSRGDDSAEPAELRILDLGCGNGTQTIQLAQHTREPILAVDNHQPYLDELRRRAEAAGVSDRIETRRGDMANLGLDEESFDLIWSEGALYVMGIHAALKAFHPVLVHGGCFGLTEMCWFRPDAPEECRQYLCQVYPAITDVDTNLAMMRACGYKLVDHFALLESAWRDIFYVPLQERVRAFRTKHAAHPAKLEFADMMQVEIDHYNKFSCYYGYEFFILQR